MIHPNMATMLAYIFTDVSLSPEKAQFYLGKAVNLSFNRISVDGDCSTNDTVFLMANGAAGVKISSTKDEEVFFQSLVDVCQALAQKIAIDGKGATKLIEVHLKNSPTQELADKASFRGVRLAH